MKTLLVFSCCFILLVFPSCEKERFACLTEELLLYLLSKSDSTTNLLLEADNQNRRVVYLYEPLTDTLMAGSSISLSTSTFVTFDREFKIFNVFLDSVISGRVYSDAEVDSVFLEVEGQLIYENIKFCGLPVDILYYH